MSSPMSIGAIAQLDVHNESKFLSSRPAQPFEFFSRPSGRA